MRKLLFAAALGMGLATIPPACGGACSHNCCAGSHCNCAGAHCCQNGADADQHCQALRRDFVCQISFKDGNGDEIDNDELLYEQFAYQQGAIDTCNAYEAERPDAPEGTASVSCSCEPIGEGPTELAAPN